MRIGIIGSRTYQDKKRIQKYVSGLPKDTVIVSGGAQGADSMAADAALDCGLNLIEHQANWRGNGVYNPRAGFERNQLIVNDSECIVAFWDGKSAGTLDTIQKAIQAGKIVKIYPDKS